ncbi:hypothetical protein IJU97_03140 [bacterium]|nr:hypothetical protein [bacterium]
MGSNSIPNISLRYSLKHFSIYCVVISVDGLFIQAFLAASFALEVQNFIHHAL